VVNNMTKKQFLELSLEACQRIAYEVGVYESKYITDKEQLWDLYQDYKEKNKVERK